MNKKILGGIAVLAVAAVAAWNVNLNSQKSDLSDLLLTNVEALADNEKEDEGSTCYNSITTMTNSKVLYCGSCSYVQNSTKAAMSGTSKCKER